MGHDCRPAKWILVLVISLTVFGCQDGPKEKESKPAVAALPDLNEQTRVYVTTNPTKVRTGPGAQFRVIADVPRDAKVNVVGRDGDWVLIVSKKGNAPGYIELGSVAAWSGETAQEAPSVEGRYEALADTQVRSGPGLHYPVVASIPKGTKLNVVDEDKGWLKVESKRGNKPGYVEASLAKQAGQ
jgi:uncharacterized protein YgiM (DUF1202 family)